MTRAGPTVATERLRGRDRVVGGLASGRERTGQMRCHISEAIGRLGGVDIGGEARASEEEGLRGN